MLIFRDKANFQLDNSLIVKNVSFGDQEIHVGLLRNKYIPKVPLLIIEDLDVDGRWFKRNGATYHTAREIIRLLHESIPGRVASRVGDHNWFSRSCHPRPSDSFLLGFLKLPVHANRPNQPRLEGEN